MDNCLPSTYVYFVGNIGYLAGYIEDRHYYSTDLMSLSASHLNQTRQQWHHQFEMSGPNITLSSDQFVKYIVLLELRINALITPWHLDI